MNRFGRAIGGYFGVEFGVGTLPQRFGDAVAVQSGRVALGLALPPTPATLWLPAYFCPPVASALEDTGWRLAPYVLKADWGPGDDVQPMAGDRVLLVNYFGLSGDAVHRAVEQFGVERVVIDASLALFSEPVSGALTAYSPRKFAPLPDGGLLMGSAMLPELAEPDEEGSALRSRHLLLRAAGDIQGGRRHYAEAEESLAFDVVPRRMSELTASLWATFDFEVAAIIRRRNYTRLSAGLRGRGFEVPELGTEAVPLCCPAIGLSPARMRRPLAECGIYCPAYWPGVTLSASDVHARKLQEETTFLPCDQRYGADDIDFILDRIDDLKDCK